jgi:phytoene dehydrogenase-like protein
LVDKLARLVPAEQEQVRRFFDGMENILSAMRSPDTEANREILEHALRISAAEYLEKCVGDWRLRRILGSIGTQEPYSGLPLLAAMWNLIANEGIYYPQGGMRKFCHGLADFISKDKAASPRTSGFGDIRLSSDVVRIRTGHDTVEGVTLQNGEEIDAAAVISNADYKTTFLNLIESGALPSAWLRAVSDARQTLSNLQVCLGLDVSKVDLKIFDESSRVIYRGSDGDGEPPNWKAEEIDVSALSGQELELSLWSGDDTSLAPEGGAVLVIRTEADHDHFTRFRPAPRRRIPGYQEYKMRLGKALVTEVEHILPGLSDAIVVMDVATPLTYEERGGRSGGAVAGWSWDYQDNMDYVPRELVRTPLRGLYLAGYQAFSSLFMGGVSTAMESGRRAAHAVLRCEDPLEEIRIPHGKAPR